MSSAEKQFWVTAEDWSRRKHLVLSYYLKPAAAKLRRGSPDGRVVIVDGFAGRGKYKDGSAGSPIHMGQLADDCGAWRDPVDLRIFNIEPDGNSFSDLEGCTRRWVEKGVVRNLHGAFREQFPDILREAGVSPMFAFLDPFAPKHLLFDDFSSLLTRSAITEFFIVFHTPAVVRMLTAVAPEARTKAKTRASLSATLEKVFGGKRWERFLGDVPITPDTVVMCFADEIAARAGEPCYIGWHDIQARHQVGLKYHIVFFTRHPDGVKLLNDAFWKEAEDVRTLVQVKPSDQMGFDFDDLMPPAEQRQTERAALLCEALVGIGAEDVSRKWRRSDLVFASILRRFGEFSEAEHNRALKNLFEQTHVPKFLPLDGKQTKKGVWITNENTMLQFLTVS